VIQRIPISTDIVYRGIEYRISESYRTDGASVRLTERAAHCGVCGRPMRRGSRQFKGCGLELHPACAIKTRCLIAVGGPS
jgi:hypothetical protein